MGGTCANLLVGKVSLLGHLSHRVATALPISTTHV
jgi:hypothetical protein